VLHSSPCLPLAGQIVCTRYGSALVDIGLPPAINASSSISATALRGPWPDWLENNTSRDRDRAATAGAEGPDLLYRFDSLGLGRDASPLLFARRARAKRPSSDLGRDRFGLDLCGAASAPRVGSMRVRASAAAQPTWAESAN
jgi:hypothetical protein